MIDAAVEHIVRREAPHVLAALVRRYGHFHLAEEAVQDALLEAVGAWRPGEVPEKPRGWLIRVAQRKLVDAMRAEAARTAREERYVALETPVSGASASDDGDAARSASDVDDSLDLLFLCCHPSLTPPSAVALTLRAVGGLTTDEIAAAFLVPSATVGQRIARAKATITASGVGFGDVDDATGASGAPDARIGAVLTVLYLVFNEGYLSAAGDRLERIDLASEAIRLTRMLHGRYPDHAETAGLLALELLHHARRDTRERDGEPVPLAEQDRARWDRALIDEGAALLERAMARGPLGRFQVQAAIAALHDTAPNDAGTDWPQVLALHDLLRHLDPSPMVELSRAVAIARVRGPRAGLDAVDAVADDPRLARSHRPAAVRAHLLDEAGDAAAAAEAYREAARRTASAPERRYLLRRAERLA